MTKGRKNIRNFIIGLCVLFAMIVALILQSKFLPEKEEKETELNQQGNVVIVEGFKITDMDSEQIEKVSYTRRDKETCSFEKKDSQWILSGDEEFPLSVESFEKQFVQKYLDAEAYQIVEGYESLSDYGIDNPEATIVVTDNKGNDRTYLIGEYNGIIGAYYVYHKEEDKLYTATGDLLYICREDVYDFAQIDNFPTFSIDSLDYMVMNNGTKKVEIKYMEDGFETDPLGTSTWYIMSPFSFYRACDTQKVTDNFEELFTGVGFTQKADYYADDEELKAYGLINSDRYYEIVYKLDDEESDSEKVSVKVVFGNYNEEKDSYYTRVILTQGFDVNTELSRSINYMERKYADSILNLDPVDYIYPYVMYVPLKEIAGGGIKITSDTGEVNEIKYEATYKDSGAVSTEKAIIDGVSVDMDDFKNFYYEFTKIYVNRAIYDKSAIVEGEPTYTFQYDRNKNDDFYGDVVVEYRVFDSTYYQVSINGIVDSYAVRRDVDKAVRLMRELK